MLSWFNRAKPKDVWDDPAEQPLGDIEAAQRIRAICYAATGNAEKVVRPTATRGRAISPNANAMSVPPGLRWRSR
jgi:hypothetical protein